MPRDSSQADSRRAYQRARILASLQVELMTAQQLADKLHLSRSGAQWHLNLMMDEAPRLVHVAGHARHPAGQRSAPMYGLGDKPDVKCPKARAPKGRITAEGRKAQILKLLAKKPLTAADVAGDLLLERARIYVIELHAAGMVHVETWRQDASGAYRAPVYAAGAGSDAARPEPQSVHEKGARAWAKLKADPHRHGLHLQRNRMRKTPQTWASALFAGMKERGATC